MSIYLEWIFLILVIVTIAMLAVGYCEIVARKCLVGARIKIPGKFQGGGGRRQ